MDHFNLIYNDYIELKQHINYNPILVGCIIGNILTVTRVRNTFKRPHPKEPTKT